MINMESIPGTFLTRVAAALADTHTGLSGTQIVEFCCDYADDFSVNIPHDECPFDAGNKKTALRQNLSPFSSEQQYRIIRELCNLDRFKGNEKVASLKSELFAKYSHFDSGESQFELNEKLIEETVHWLSDFPDSLNLFRGAVEKYKNQFESRGALDDLRLALELLLKVVLENNKSLENQKSELGGFLKEKGGSKEFVNMFQTLVVYYTKYQNEHVKHTSNLIKDEVEFVFEITSSFMKHVVRLSL